ncbi:MAG: 4'-phosphopantetheinyl transferase superfamily protein [Planctomycetaceae bacterium]
MTFAEVESEWDRLELPPLEELLSPPEQAELSILKAETRRSTWLAGRKLLRLMLLEERKIAPGELTIQTRNDQRQGIRPLIHYQNQLLPGCFSLTHSDSRVAVDWSEEPGISIGIDLITPASISPTQFDWALTDSEKTIIQGGGDSTQLTSAIWALKEATYKAANQQGEGFNPQQVTLNQNAAGEWYAHYRGEDLSRCGQWSVQSIQDDLLARVVLKLDS